MKNLKVFIITGTVGSGKTHFITNLFEFLSLFEKSICGFVSRGIFDEEGRKEFLLRDLSDGQEWPLASRGEKDDWIKQGPFWFNPDALGRGNKIIRRGIEDKCRVLLIDEIGPVELSGGAWHGSFVKVLQKFNGILIVTIREPMIEKIMEKYGIHEAFIENIDLTTPRKAGESVLSLLKQEVK
jgi:nucleoside-triphosphatase THEP1